MHPTPVFYAGLFAQDRHTQAVDCVHEALCAAIPRRVRRELGLDLWPVAKVVADTIRCRSGHYRAVTAKDVRDAMERCGMRPVGAGRAAAWHRDTYGDGRPWTW